MLWCVTEVSFGPAKTMIKKVGNAKEFGNFDLIERRIKDLYIQKGKGKNNMQFSQLQKMHINQMTS